MTFNETIADLKARIASSTFRKKELKAEKVTFDAALKRAKSDCDYNATMRRWNQDDLTAAKAEMKAAKVAERARKAEAKAAKPKRQTKAQREQDAANRFYANERNNDEARARAEEQRRADAAEEASWNDYRRQQDEGYAQRDAEEAEAARRAQENGHTVTRESVAEELCSAPYNLHMTTVRVRNNFEFRCEISSSEVKRLRRVFMLANMDAANSATNHDKIAFANAIFDEIDSEKRAHSEEISSSARAAAHEAQEAYRARRSANFW